MAIKMQHDTTLDLEVMGYFDRGDESVGVKPGFVITAVMLGGCDIQSHLSKWDIEQIQEYCDYEVDE